VYVGKLDTKEIDFIGINGDKRIYVQVCDQMPSGSFKEIENLKAIKDNYPKYVVTLDRLAVGNEDGIIVIHLIDFLLGSW
jgi:predicted AAA+ superfamily ATPase